MKKLLLLSGLLLFFFACKKDDKRTTTSFGQAVDAMRFSYDKTYIFFFQRNSVLDSDRVIFHANGTVTEISNRFDSSSYSFPDTLTYAVNTSFDDGIVWDNIANIQLFSFYPLPNETRNPSKHFLLHDYLLSEVVNVYKNKGSYADPSIKNIPTAEDSVAIVTGFVKKDPRY